MRKRETHTHNQKRVSVRELGVGQKEEESKEGREGEWKGGREDKKKPGVVLGLS